MTILWLCHSCDAPLGGFHLTSCPERRTFGETRVLPEHCPRFRHEGVYREARRRHEGVRRDVERRG